MRLVLRTAAMALAILPSVRAWAAPAHHKGHAHIAQAERPLTIGGHPRGIYRVGNTIVAPGGFGAHGYGYPPATRDERRDARNEAIRAGSTGLYGSGFDGLGGTGFSGDGEAGYDNPFYGNAFNRYVGYNGVPSDLAFGPAFANRHLAGHDPVDDDEPGPPSPGELGYGLLAPAGE